MRAFIEGKVVNYSTVNELARKVIFDKMYEEGSTSMTDYLEGWVVTMDEIDSENGEDFTPYTIDSVLPIALGTIENEVGSIEGNTILVGKSPEGFYEALKSVINEMRLAEA